LDAAEAEIDVVVAVDVVAEMVADEAEISPVFRILAKDLLHAEISNAANVSDVSANFLIIPDRQKIGLTVPDRQKICPQMAPTTIEMQDQLTMPLVPNHGVNDLKRKVLRPTEALLMLMSLHGEM